MRIPVLLFTACLTFAFAQPLLAQATRTATAEKPCGTLFDFVEEPDISTQHPAVISASRLEIKTPPITNPGLTRKFMDQFGFKHILKLPGEGATPQERSDNRFLFVHQLLDLDGFMQDMSLIQALDLASDLKRIASLREQLRKEVSQLDSDLGPKQ